METTDYSPKSHVSLEQNVCPVCARTHDVGVLLHRQMKQGLPSKTVTGWSMCPEHEKLRKEGYIALVGVDQAKSDGFTAAGVWRTGKLAHLKESAWGGVFNMPPPAKALCFVPDDVIEMLENSQKTPP